MYLPLLSNFSNPLPPQTELRRKRSGNDPRCPAVAFGNCEPVTESLQPVVPPAVMIVSWTATEEIGSIGAPEREIGAGVRMRPPTSLVGEWETEVDASKDYANGSPSERLQKRANPLYRYGPERRGLGVCGARRAAPHPTRPGRRGVERGGEAGAGRLRSGSVSRSRPLPAGARPREQDTVTVIRLPTC